MKLATKLNESAHEIALQCVLTERRLHIESLASLGTTIIDFGVHTQGGLEAGTQLARMCMAGLGEIHIQPPNLDMPLVQVMVRTDHPVEACLQSQYAGWKISTDDYFAMGSGPMRAAAALEDLFCEFASSESHNVSVGILEAASLPTESAIAEIRKSVGDSELFIAVAPTASQAGNLQVVARSVETALHKLHEIGFPVASVVSATGVAPLPPVARNDLEGIGRTNDAILYGSTVNLWVDCDDALIERSGPMTPSSSSSSHGQNFLTLFKNANHDFYALDKALFSPAKVIFHNVKSGRSFVFGNHSPQLLLESFGV